MNGLRDMLDLLRRHGELEEVTDPVDVREVTPLVWRTDKALHFRNVVGYEAEMAGGLVTTRRRAALVMGCEPERLGQRFLEGVEHPIAPVLLEGPSARKAPAKEVVEGGPGPVDLTFLPIPFMHARDGGPFLTSAVVIARDPEYGRNAGIYRLMYRTPDEFSIDLMSHSDLRFFYERALAGGRPLPVTAVLGLDYLDMLAATYKSPTGTDELAIAGGLKGEPLPLVRCETVDLEVPAYAEVVLEGHLLPIGWTVDEGPFGDMCGINGGLKMNPVFKVTAVTRRRRPIIHFLRMPRENNLCHCPAIEAAALRALQNARVDVAAVHATLGGMSYWEVIAAIRKRPGEAKNALLALLSVAEVKLAIVTDDDIDIYDHEEVEWAMALRVQADEDVIIVPGTRGKHLDPSAKLVASRSGSGALAVMARLGIDATMPDDISPERYERVVPATAPAEALARAAGSPGGDLRTRILGLLGKPIYFNDIVAALGDSEYRAILAAWGAIRRTQSLERDTQGRYWLTAAGEKEVL
jgi:2,5-furandicarboxylate decarboxylase 1